MMILFRNHQLFIKQTTLIFERNFISANLHKSKQLIGLVGVCEDGNSSYLKGTAQAPPKIRECFQCDCSNSYSESRINITTNLFDYGDITPSNDWQRIQDQIRKICHDQRIPLILGGDHSITAPIFIALQKKYHEPITIVHFDAHPDLYPTFQDNPHSHASPFARILEQHNICKQLISIGIRTINDIQEKQIEKYGVVVIEAKDFPAKGNDIKPILDKHITKKSDLVYISVDIDVLEPGLAPGISHPESGGLSTRQLIDAIHAIPGTIVGADIVEYNPTKDVRDLTGFIASKLLKELSSKIIISNR